MKFIIVISYFHLQRRLLNTATTRHSQLLLLCYFSKPAKSRVCHFYSTCTQACTLSAVIMQTAKSYYIFTSALVLLLVILVQRMAVNLSTHFISKSSAVIFMMQSDAFQFNNKSYISTLNNESKCWNFDKQRAPHELLSVT